MSPTTSPASALVTDLLVPARLASIRAVRLPLAANDINDGNDGNASNDGKMKKMTQLKQMLTPPAARRSPMNSNTRAPALNWAPTSDF